MQSFDLYLNGLFKSSIVLQRHHYLHLIINNGFKQTLLTFWNCVCAQTTGSGNTMTTLSAWRYLGRNIALIRAGTCGELKYSFAVSRAFGNIGHQDEMQRRRKTHQHPQRQIGQLLLLVMADRRLSGLNRAMIEISSVDLANHVECFSRQAQERRGYQLKGLGMIHQGMGQYSGCIIWK